MRVWTSLEIFQKAHLITGNFKHPGNIQKQQLNSSNYCQNQSLLFYLHIDDFLAVPVKKKSEKNSQNIFPRNLLIKILQITLRPLK